MARRHEISKQNRRPLPAGRSAPVVHLRAVEDLPSALESYDIPTNRQVLGWTGDN